MTPRSCFPRVVIDDGWTHKYFKYFDYLKFVNTDYVTSWEERDRYENILVSRNNDGKDDGNLSIRDHFKNSSPITKCDHTSLEKYGFDNDHLMQNLKQIWNDGD